MANSLQAKKRIRQNEKLRLSNKACRSKIKTQSKKVMAAIEKKETKTAETEFRAFVHQIDRAVTRGVFERNTANRRKSRLARRIHSLQPAGKAK